MEKSHEIPSFPFKFLGGFDLSAKSIGFILSLQGFFQMIVQIFIFPMINKKLGSLWTFRLVAMGYPFLYFLIPYLTVLPQNLRMLCIYPILLWKVTSQALSYPSNAMMLANSAPSRKVLGTVNGVAASAASLSRALGPTLSGSIQAAGLQMGSIGLPWWITSIIAGIGTVLSFAMVEVRGQRIEIAPEDHASIGKSCKDTSGGKRLQSHGYSEEAKESIE